MEKLNLQFNLDLDIDGNEIIHSIQFNSENKKVLDIITSLKPLVLKQKALSIFNLSHIELDFPKKDSFLVDIILGKIRKSIQLYRGEQGGILSLKQTNKNELLCRCKALTYKDVDDLYVEHKGDRKKILIESEMSGICGSCKTDFSDYFRLLESKSTYIQGEESIIWVERINLKLNEFLAQAPEEFKKLDLSVLSLNVHMLKIKCIREEGSSLKRMEIQKILLNYLFEQLGVKFNLSVVI